MESDGELGKQHRTVHGMKLTQLAASGLTLLYSPNRCVRHGQWLEAFRTGSPTVSRDGHGGILSSGRHLSYVFRSMIHQVFTSASADKTVAVWDLRRKNGSMLSLKAHEEDVNVISWNRNVTYLLASGSDDGSFKIWDLRAFRSGEPVAQFRWHKVKRGQLSPRSL